MAAAYVLIHLNIDVDFPETLAAIRRIGAVKQAHLVVGPTDCIAFVEADDDPALLEVLQAIRAVEGVERTDTRTVADL